MIEFNYDIPIKSMEHITFCAGPSNEVCLYCPGCDGELYIETKMHFSGYISCWVKCFDCGLGWAGNEALSQINIAFAELTAWQTCNHFGEWEL
jgi:hypothetical protein